MTTGPDAPKPVLTLDLDGVICAPVLGQNLGISTAFLDPTAEPTRAFVWPRWIGGPLDTIRFGIRRPLPEGGGGPRAARRAPTVGGADRPPFRSA